MINEYIRLMRETDSGKIKLRYLQEDVYKGFKLKQEEILESKVCDGRDMVWFVDKKGYLQFNDRSNEIIRGCSKNIVGRSGKLYKKSYIEKDNCILIIFKSGKRRDLLILDKRKMVN